MTEPNEAIATFAGGCFWCIESDFEKLLGVKQAINGYTGGQTKNPTYEEVCTGTTGHFEAVQVIYDPKVITYEALLDHFWTYIDPTDQEGQFADKGSQYLTAIFYCNEAQKVAAEYSKNKVEASGKFKSIATRILPAGTFYPAEEYHQDYYKKNPIHYQTYRRHSGRDSFLEQTWQGTGDTLKEKLTPLQYYVTQQCGTEKPFDNLYWDHKEPGIYVDIVSGEPLFCSLDKFDSGTGWPSFKKPLEEYNITKEEDDSLGSHRIEVRSKHANSHLGHVFPDGPGPTGLRYCINSAALLFIPKSQLAEEGYGEYISLFRDE